MYAAGQRRTANRAYANRKPRQPKQLRETGVRDAKPDDFFEKEAVIQRPSPLDHQYVKMAKIVELSNIVSSTTAPVFRSLFFKFSDISDSTELGGIFDQYKFGKVSIRVVPNIKESISSTPILGRNYSVIDFDDANAFTSITDPLDYSNCRVHEPIDTMQVELVPHFAYSAFATGVFSSFANSAPRWIDCASPDVQHYGVKYAIGNTTTSITYTITCRYEIYLRMTH